MDKNNNLQPVSYKFSFADPGLFVEIYVPTTYEQQVREALLKGMDLNEVKRYLRGHWHDIRSFLLEDEALLKRYDRPDGIDQLNDNPLKGFSIYQADGAFGDCHGIASERVSVVRLLFVAPLTDTPADRLSKERFWARRFLRFWTHDTERYRIHLDSAPSLSRNGERQTSEDDAEEHELVNRLNQWLVNIDLVVNGYVIYSLCREIEWRANHQLTDKREDEIWIGSLRTLAVNRVRPRTKDDDGFAPPS